MNMIRSCLLKNNYSFKSENNCYSIYMNKTFNGHTSNVNGLLNLDHVIHIFIILMPKDAKLIMIVQHILWHFRLGHIGVKRMKKLHMDGFLESLDYESFDTCEPCLMGKMTKTPLFGTMERANDLLEIIHTNVCGPMSVEAHGGYRCFVTFTDDLSRYGYIYLMKHKSETFEKFKEISE